MIERLEVVGLNHQFDYGLKFNPDLNIFTGSNGCGKTTLLKLMWYLISGNLHRIITEIPFEFVLIETDQFSFSMAPSKTRSRNNLHLVWKFGTEEEKSEPIRRSGFLRNQTVLSLNRRIASVSQNSLFFPTFRRIEGGYSHFSRFVERTTEESEVLRLLSSASDMLHGAMSRFSDEVSNDGHKFISAISTKDLEDLLPLKRAEIHDKVDKLYAEFSRGLSTKIPSHRIRDLGEANKRFVRIRDDYAKVDFKRQELLNPLTVLNQFINTVFQNRKIQITEEITLGGERGRKGEAISSDRLSAGQQQMLSFLCYNAFSSDTRIFIDEPELSLHINWQRHLPDILLAQGTTNQFFIATHAPTIYANYPDKELRLGELEEEEIE